MMTPRVAAIHDMSGFGRCSLTVAIPILSAMGVQCCPLPTAFLSTHTGGFEGFTFLDMTDEMPRVARHWKQLDLRFQALYSGFLGSERQIGIVEDFIRDFRTDGTIVVVDPVMGDHGKVYQTYTPAMCAGTAHLAAQADVITPNLTEAALLLDEPFCAAPRTGGEVEALLKRLLGLGARSVVLTSVPMEDGSMANAWMRAGDQSHGEMRFHPLPIHYPGTGDLFASVLTGALLRGQGLEAAVRRAAGYIYHAMEITNAVGSEPRMGVQFEKNLWELADAE